MIARFAMKTATRSAILLTIAAQTSLCQITAPKEARVMNVLPTQSKSIAVTNATAHDVVKKLRSEGIRVCFEENSATSGDVVSFVEDESSTTNLLQNVVARLPGYAWYNPKGTDIVVVFPSETSALTWNVSSLDATNVSFLDIVVKNDMLGLKQHDIIVFYRGFTQPLEFTVNARFRNKLIMECLNDLIVNRPGLCWTLVTNPRGKKVLAFQYVEVFL
ncbi:MAG: hypothetical protein ACOX5G_10415 [Kiritimatiellia bacterium]